MELHVLGSSSKGNGYVLEATNEALIIEAGIKLIEAKKAINFNLAKVVGCIVSHQHGDHAGYIQEYVDAGITALVLPSVITSKKLTSNYKTIEFGKGYIFGGFKILPFELMHDVPCAGFMVEHPESGKILFITDTYACKYRFSGLSHMLIEANYADDILTENILEGRVPQIMRKRLITSHMEIESTKDLLRTSDLSAVQNIVLIHLSDGNSNRKRFEEECREVTGCKVMTACPGITINFDSVPL